MNYLLDTCIISELVKPTPNENVINWLNQTPNERLFLSVITIAENWGNIQGKAENNGTPLASLDSLIAAVAYTYNLIVVTRNESDFTASNVTLLNPWNNKG